MQTLETYLLKFTPCLLLVWILVGCSGPAFTTDDTAPDPQLATTGGQSSMIATGGSNSVDSPENNNYGPDATGGAAAHETGGRMATGGNAPTGGNVSTGGAQNTTGGSASAPCLGLELPQEYPAQMCCCITPSGAKPYWNCIDISGCTAGENCGC